MTAFYSSKNCISIVIWAVYLRKINFGKPYTGESYDAAALLVLAMQAAGSNNRTAIASNVMAVANSPGELGKGLRILANGGAVDYVGASNVELIGEGESSGSYLEFEIKGKAFVRVRYR